VSWNKPGPLTLIVLCLLGAHVVATAVFPPGSYPLTIVGNVFPLCCGLLLTAQCLRNSRSAAGPLRIFWLLVAGSFALHILSQLYFGYFEVVKQQDVTGPWGDCLFFLLPFPFSPLSACARIRRAPPANCVFAISIS